MQRFSIHRRPRTRCHVRAIANNERVPSPVPTARQLLPRRRTSIASLLSDDTAEASSDGDGWSAGRGSTRTTARPPHQSCSYAPPTSARAHTTRLRRDTHSHAYPDYTNLSQTIGRQKSNRGSRYGRFAHASPTPHSTSGFVPNRTKSDPQRAAAPRAHHDALERDARRGVAVEHAPQQVRKRLGRGGRRDIGCAPDGRVPASENTPHFRNGWPGWRRGNFIRRIQAAFNAITCK